jgi:hypothetical protein
VAVVTAPALDRTYRGPAELAVGLADDLAYQAGVWAGVGRRRSAAALLPRW